MKYTLKLDENGMIEARRGKTGKDIISIPAMHHKHYKEVSDWLFLVCKESWRVYQDSIAAYIVDENLNVYELNKVPKFEGWTKLIFQMSMRDGMTLMTDIFLEEN